MPPETELEEFPFVFFNLYYCIEKLNLNRITGNGIFFQLYIFSHLVFKIQFQFTVTNIQVFQEEQSSKDG